MGQRLVSGNPLPIAAATPAPAGKMKWLIIVSVIFSSSFATRLLSSDELEALFTRVLRRGVTPEDADTFQDVVDILHRPHTLREARGADFLSATRMTLDCLVCRSAFAALFTLVGEGQPDAALIGSVGFLCTALGIESAPVCDGAIKLNLPILTHIIKSQPAATPGALCGLVLQAAAEPGVCPLGDARFEWAVSLPDAPAAPTQPAPSAEPPLTVALVTDAHIDPLYEASGAADCGEPVCCRRGQAQAQSYVFKSNVGDDVLDAAIVEEGGLKLDLSVAERIRKLNSGARTRYPAPRNSPPAGYWGDYRNCDTPIWAYDDVIDRIKEAHPNIDAIYYIGDTIDHGVWETSYELIDDMNRHVVDKIRGAFPGTPLVPTIGNHESQPTNQFAPASVTEPGLNTTWLYRALADKWAAYLPEEARQSLLQRGDFVVQLRPGLRVVSLNNNVAYKYNWWLVYDPSEQQRQLEWLVEQLGAAERDGERVHILAHIPPGVSDLTHAWTREYNRVVNRFANTIAAEFNGHTHSDEFKVFYDAGGVAAGVAWGAGSATAYTFYNLNYKIATVDPATYELINIQNYVYNLTEANLTPLRRPHWFQLYDIRNTFGLTDLSPASMDDLVHRMVTTEKPLLDIYSAFFSKLSDSRWPGCGEGCKLDNLCKIVVTVLWERQKCEELVALFHS